MPPWAHPSPHPKRHLDRFIHFCTAHSSDSLYFTMGCPFSLSKLPIRMGVLDPSNTWFLQLTRVRYPNGTSIASVILRGLMTVTDRQTDRQTGRPHNFICKNRLQNTVRQCSLIIKLEMWSNAQRDGRPAKYRWRPLFNAAKFGWRPLLEYHAVMLPRCKTHWNLLGCPNSPTVLSRYWAEVHHIMRTCGGGTDV